MKHTTYLWWLISEATYTLKMDLEFWELPWESSGAHGDVDLGYVPLSV